MTIVHPLCIGRSKYQISKMSPPYWFCNVCTWKA